MSTNTDSPFVRASDLPAAGYPSYRVKKTEVEYGDGTSALTIYAGDSDESRFATTAWVSALGESFVSLEDCR
ncbi:hypothetical protein Htur_5080 (plasmid) [Haloterrigena turkmenica DSM 5511]|uniref:DUF7511 domain-containing protein n=1 Tax=Haloterrigena turkmenica (strain ATCC 51198 / DSM 5511 / JCM 9101 / NCIMB 13204 / VKM B-1734 / 4k) TaxID=543526 RepID=D2S3M0_HALTV|nr:hypothetical protein [Haloterrigena turkmenica]ADB63967.1 hypothetical protein Htur_5080 [Haloterrigena turkmenica DSM 5511]